MKPGQPIRPRQGPLLAKYVWSLALLLSLVAASPRVTAASQERDRPIVRVGVVIDGPGASNDEITALVTTEAVELNRRRFDVRFPDEAMLVGDWSFPTTRSQLSSLLEDPSIDIVLAMGVIAGTVATSTPDLPKPVIAPFVVDPELGGLPLAVRQTADGRRIRVSGVSNLSLTVPVWNVERDIAEFRRWVPFRRAAVFLDARVLAAIPELEDRLDRMVEESGAAMDFDLIGVEGDGAAALAQMAEDVDAAVIGVLLNTPDDEVGRLLAAVNERRLPSFALLGRPDVERGAMLGLSAESELQRIARRTAIHLQRILLGEAPSELPVDMPLSTRLTFNRNTARAVGFAAPWELLTDAEVIDTRRRDVRRQLRLEDAIEAALRENLDLSVIEAEIRAGESGIRSTRSGLLPQVGFSTSALWIDSDRAEASFGSQAERSLTASIAGSWALLSESTRAAVDGVELRQEALQAERQQLRLDIAGETAAAFLSVLRARTGERVRSRNLEVTRLNLELARQRRRVGAATAAEEARWESELALDQREAIAATALRNQAEIALNQLMHAPLEEPFEPVEGDLEAVWEREYQVPLERYLGTQEGFDVFREFMAREALLNAPELRQIDAFIDAQRRVLLAARRAMWMPDVSLGGRLDRIVTKGGAGDTGGATPGPFALPSPSDTSWNVALSASLPLFAGGFRVSERQRALAELEGLQRQRRATAERVEQRVRSELHAAGASWAAIGLTRRAAAAARRNLELVQDAYGQGLATVVQLVDAQNAALVAELAAENALYDHFTDLFEVERGAGRIRILDAPEQRLQWRQALEEFYEAQTEVPDAR